MRGKARRRETQRETREKQTERTCSRRHPREATARALASTHESSTCSTRALITREEARAKRHAREEARVLFTGSNLNCGLCRPGELRLVATGSTCDMNADAVSYNACTNC